MSIALVFPGQGSQSVGMLAALTARYASAAQCFEQASQALGFDLRRLVAEGPAERLNATEYTQPAMLVAGVATWRAWCEQGGAAPTAVAGHSLGEFTALVCAQALPFEAAVQLVQYRGQIMQRAMPEGAGAMAAILGIEDAEVAAACAEGSQGEVVEAVNFNFPGQVVIAGHASAVERAMELARQRGAKRCVLLPVSVPAHSSLMREAAQQLSGRLDRIDVRPPVYRYISAVDAAEHSDPADIRATLVRQLASPVRWSETVRALLALAPTLIECGPGKVLTGLIRRIERAASCYALEDPESVAAAVAATSAAAAPGAVHA
ncbi:MAG TPA: ACP S-malonyltransferase [Steroidobacteraceae bacterium]|jgi:[acyl-carrier-protein] S-malonyltransferase|nr:ACP S-malonyltransferase [Steroidobacteraceae bacterium]